MFPNDFGDGFFRLPKYVVSFYHSNITHSVNYGDGKSRIIELPSRGVVHGEVLQSIRLICHLIPCSGSWFGAAGDYAVEGGEKLFAGELSPVYPLCIDQLG